MFRKFNITNQVENQRNLRQDLGIIDRDMGGSIDRSSKYTKSIAQERVERWTKTRRNKADFPVLHKDEDHRVWKIKFVAEIHSQGLSDMINQDYDPNLKPCSYKTI